MGFEQVRLIKGKVKVGTKEEKDIENTSFPTPWNQIEAGILFGLRLPLLIFKEKEISGGVFDFGISDVFVHSFPDKMSAKKRDEIKQVIQKWYAEVSVLHNQF